MGPCTFCSNPALCPGGVKRACEATRDIECNPPCAGGTFSASGYAPCAACSDAFKCVPYPVESVCTARADLTCKRPCVAGSTYSIAGVTPCVACTWTRRNESNVPPVVW